MYRSDQWKRGHGVPRQQKHHTGSGENSNGENHIHGSRQHGIRPQHHRRLHVPRSVEGFPLRAVRHRRRTAQGVGVHPQNAERQHQRQPGDDHHSPRRPRPQGGAPQCGLRRQRHPGRRIRTLNRHRLRDSQEIRPSPDHRRHARHRRHLPCTADDSGDARLRPRDRRGRAECLVPQLHQSDGDAHRRDAPRQRREDGRSLPLGPGLRQKPADHPRPGV